MKSEDLRQKFLGFFEKKGHKVCKSDYLVPPSDPTLLFTTAGMVQFKPLWAGAKLDFSRAASVQKCLRAGGKGSDLENVGKTLRHHTFFEMLGNFSFGDYFKEEAIVWAWEFVVEVLRMDSSKIFITVFKDDDEAAQIWQKKIGIAENRIIRLGEKDNFWGPAGEEGACGPCSEILFDLGEGRSCGRPDCSPGCDCERYLEFWNLVFPQFYQKKDGTREPLQRRGIDTGMGLERLAFLVQQDARNNYETDLFQPIISETERICEQRPDKKTRPYFHVIADHVRALTFAISENILPSNEGRGYVLRRILRRSFRAGRKIGLTKPFLYRIVPVVSEIMKGRYPELADAREFVSRVVLGEEERFEVTLDNAYHILVQEVEKARSGVFSGIDIFRLYDTYGMPVDIIKEEVEERGLIFDEEGFEKQMSRQKEKGKKSWKGTDFQMSEIYSRICEEKGETPYTGYERISDHSDILCLVRGGSPVNRVKKGERAECVLSHTNFYAESGGQVGDTGIIQGENGKAVVLDTQRDVSGIVIHHIKVEEGMLSEGESVDLFVDEKRRKEISKHHTATHLLQSALRKHLGHHVKQSGSFVDPDRLRFDFSHFKSLSRQEIDEVEKEVNDIIQTGIDVSANSTSYDNAVGEGAIAIFGEKYGDTVRVVNVGEKSRELCGGVHVRNTSEIGGFKIISESSVSSGVRRIEAVCGRSLVNHYMRTDAVMRSILSLLKTSESDIFERVKKLAEKVRSLEKKLEKGAAKEAQSHTYDIQETVDDIIVMAKIFTDAPVPVLRKVSDEMKSKVKSGVFYISSRDDNDRTTMILSCTKSVISRGFDCGKFLSALAKKYGGGGGGRKDMAQAGVPVKVNARDVIKEIKSLLKDTF